MNGVVTAYTAADLITVVGNTIETVLGWVSTVIGALLNDNGALSALLPLFAVTISISAILLGVRIIKSFVWGA